MRKINHPNVIKYYSFDISPDNNQVEIVLEYAKYGSLKDLLAQNGPFSERETAGYCRQILEALKYLHG